MEDIIQVTIDFDISCNIVISPESRYNAYHLGIRESGTSFMCGYVPRRGKCTTMLSASQKITVDVSGRIALLVAASPGDVSAFAS